MKNPYLSATPETESTMTRGAADALARAGFSRRAFIKGTGALIVSFSMGGALRTLEAQRAPAGAFGDNGAPDSPPASEVDSWIAIGSDGSVTAYTGKEELGQGMSTAQTQLVAEEMCVPLNRVNLIAADTSMCPDQGVTSGSQSFLVSRGGFRLHILDSGLCALIDARSTFRSFTLKGTLPTACTASGLAAM